MISVCIPTYNGEKYIEEQLLSILGQLEEDDEVIISDDGSDDKTIEIINDLRDDRIQLLFHKPFSNSNYKFDVVTRNVENALKMAKGQMIFLADQDDIWMDGKVKTIKKLLQVHDLVLHDCKVVDASRKIINKSYYEIIPSSPGIVRNLIKNSYLGCCMAFNKEILIQKVLPFPVKSVPHDIWIGLIYEYYGKVFFCNETLLEYRRHGGNISASSENSNNEILYKVRYRFNILSEFIKRLIRR